MEALQVGKNPLLAILADDHSKAELVDTLRSWSGDLQGVTLVATRDTGNLIRSRLGLDVALVESGDRGGALQIAALVVEGAVSAVVALQRPSMVLEGNTGTMALRHVCDIHDVAFASSLATADAVIAALVHAGSGMTRGAVSTGEGCDTPSRCMTINSDSRNK